MSTNLPPVTAQILDAIGGVIADRAGIDLMLARSIAGDVMATLREPGREWAQRHVAAQDAADLFGRDFMDAMKGELCLVFVKKLGGSITLPVAEVDDTAGWQLCVSADPQASTLTFTARKK